MCLSCCGNFLIEGTFDENTGWFLGWVGNRVFAKELVELFNIEMIKVLRQPGYSGNKTRRSIVFSPNKRFRSLVSYLRSKEEERLPAIRRRIQSDLG